MQFADNVVGSSIPTTGTPRPSPLVVGANDAPRTDVGKVARCEFVVGVVVKDY